MNQLGKLGLFILLVLQVQCAPELEQSTQSIDPLQEALGPSPISISRQEVVGSGRVIATSTLRSPRSNFHLHLAGYFIEPSSTLTLHLFFDDFSYDTGLLLRLSLPEDYQETGRIDVDFAEPGRSFRHLTTIEKSLGPDMSFVLRIEAHNKFNNDQRLLVWNDALFLGSDQREVRDRLTMANADFDSFDERNIFFTWGRGPRWGLHLNKMRLYRVLREVPIADL